MPVTLWYVFLTSVLNPWVAPLKVSQPAKEKLKIQQLEVDEHKKEIKVESKKNAEILDKLNHIKKWLEFLEGEV